MIELVASDAVSLDASSILSARGDSRGTSSGGTVTIKAANTFSDQPTSTINVSGGAEGGNGGQTGGINKVSVIIENMNIYKNNPDRFSKRYAKLFYIN